jgi:hypothetical protein
MGSKKSQVQGPDILDIPVREILVLFLYKPQNTRRLSFSSRPHINSYRSFQRNSALFVVFNQHQFDTIDLEFIRSEVLVGE